MKDWQNYVFVILSFVFLGLIAISLAYGGAANELASAQVSNAESDGVIESVECCSNGRFIVTLKDTNRSYNVDSIILTNPAGEYSDEIAIRPSVRRVNLGPFTVPTGNGEWSVVAVTENENEETETLGSADFTVDATTPLPYIPANILVSVSAVISGVIGGLLVRFKGLTIDDLY